MRNEIITMLKQESDSRYKDFARKSCPDAGFVYGVRLPDLRKISFYIDRTAPILFLKECRNESLEEELLMAMTAAHLKTEERSRYSWYRKVIRSLHNWEVCDTFCGELGHYIRDKEEFHEFILRYLHSRNEFEQRFCFVSLLHCFCKEESREILKLIPNVRFQGKYAQTGAAWLIAECMCYSPAETLRFLKEYTKDETVFRTSIRKIRESYRITDNLKIQAGRLLNRNNH
ncbi:MAG: DNA alkylation repair protein [Erysipelotrichia bacterium]|nr:DNA alkylation repair protein [Erysipelotrichia bacterium]